MSKYLRIPFDEDDADRISTELSLKEQKKALIQAYKESINSDEPDDPTEIESYNTKEEIDKSEQNGIISEATAVRLRIKANRYGLPR